jgi:glycosyltransferase involved in cell wall biosynthesis
MRESDDGRVTVIIPTYNRAAVLRRAVDSVRAQTAADCCDVLIVDDGSTDGTARVLAELGPGVQVVRQANAGGAAARNTGIRASRGEFVAFLDSDDYWLPDKIERQLAAMRRWPDIALVAGRASGFYPDGRVTHDPPSPVPAHAPTDFAPALCDENFLHTPAVMVRRRTLLAAGLFPEDQRRCHDYPLWVRVALRGPGVYLDHEVARFSGATPGSLQSDRWAALRANHAARRLVWADVRGRADCRAAWRRGFLRQTVALRDRAFRAGDFAAAVHFGCVAVRYGWREQAGWEWRQLLAATGLALLGRRGRHGRAPVEGVGT